MPTLLRVRNLAATFVARHSAPHRALDAVSFDVSTGEVLGLMGESGCGKTTLALSLLGLHDPDGVAVSGTAEFLDQDLLQLDEGSFRKIRGARISLICQEPGVALSPVRQVGEQIREVAHAHLGQSWKACRRAAEWWLARVGLEPAANFFARYPHQLSIGELQRVVLVQALISEPLLLVADEPTASLDAVNQAAFVTLLRSLKSELGLSVLLVSHTPEIQASLADRLLVMQRGKIIEQGAALDILGDPREAYTRALLRRPTKTFRPEPAPCAACEASALPGEGAKP